MTSLGRVMPPSGNPGRFPPNEDATPEGFTAPFGRSCLEAGGQVPPPPKRRIDSAPRHSESSASESVGNPAGVSPLPSGPSGPKTSSPGRVAPARGHFEADRSQAPRRGAPQLDTLGTSRHPSARTRDSAVQASRRALRIDWLRKVEANTIDHRERKALDFEAKARRLEKCEKGRQAVALARGEAVDHRRVAKAGRWHRSRAQGQRFRFSNAINCGASPSMLRVSCGACGNVTDHPLTCGATLACIACRGRLQAERRAQVGNGVRIIERRGKTLGLLRKNRKGGRWSHKFITLTIPHERHHTIGDRIELAHRAWTHFLKSFNGWLRARTVRAPHCSADAKCGTCERCTVTWYGSHEWTVGDDERGHPHVQLWFFGPFVDREDLSDMWRAALEKAGLGDPVEDNGRTRFRWEGDVITEVQEAKDARGGIYELIKYVVKDIVADGEFVRAKLYGELFESLDGRRLRRGSKGFIALCETPIPCSCGAVGCYSTKILERPDPIEAGEREAIERSCGP
jgi:hypothetical protein